MKDYAGAVAAYENAFQFEPENQVTWTYLNKAKKKFKRENERKRRKEEAEIDALNGKRVGSGDGQGHGDGQRHEEVQAQAQDSNHGSSSSRGRGADRSNVRPNRRSSDNSRGIDNYRSSENVSQNGNNNENAHAMAGGDDNVENYVKEEQYDENGNANDDGDGDADDSFTNDGLSITHSEQLKNMAISVVGETNHNGKDHRSVAVLSTHVEGDDIDQLVAAVDRGETSIVRGKLQAALDSSNAPSPTPHSQLDMHDRDHDVDPLDDSEYTNGNETFEDPDFDEALRLQELAAIKLINKEYRGAVEEFSAALFLVPDDTNLTPQLYVGRAHALNGLQRHEGALNDAMMALGRNPELPEAHVVLARTYFYVKNFSGAISSFETAKEILKEKDLGDQLSPLDELYYEKAIENNHFDLEVDDEKSYRSRGIGMQSDKPIPKLKPPRFVSRQEVRNELRKLC